MLGEVRVWVRLLALHLQLLLQLVSTCGCDVLLFVGCEVWSVHCKAVAVFHALLALPVLQVGLAAPRVPRSPLGACVSVCVCEFVCGALPTASP